MKFAELYTIKKPYFGYEEIARVLGIRPSSAKVSAGRYVQQGLLLRIKKNMYVLRETLNNAGREEKFVLANLGQSPSYISLMTALDYCEITTQLQRDTIECIALKRTKEIGVNEQIFRYTKIKKDLFFGFVKKKDFFIATPEKALLDAFYLMSYGRYGLDLSALDREKVDVDQMGRYFPEKTRSLLKKHGYLGSA
jgi:predicted transcriptional regulator of viral defense system